MLNLREFWNNCLTPVYDMDSEEPIDSKQMLEWKEMDVIEFAPFKDGIAVKLDWDDDGVEEPE